MGIVLQFPSPRPEPARVIWWQDLSFAGGCDRPWNPVRTGEWAADNRAGRAYARELADHIAATGCPSILGHVHRAIADAGEFDGVEAGFFGALAETLIPARAAG